MIKRLAPDRFTWLNFAPVERVKDGVSKKGFTFYGLQNLPNFPQDPADISYTVKSRDRIENLAYKYYGEVQLWWVIAYVNDMMLPDADMFEGRVIRIPAPRVVRDVLGVS